jgi:hypothetical protein
MKSAPRAGVSASFLRKYSSKLSAAPLEFLLTKSARRPLVRAAALLLLAIAALPVFAAEKPRLRVDDYQIDAEITPRTHRLAARARVKFTALDDINTAVFELHNALHPSKVEDAAGHVLSVERVTQDSTIRIPLPAALPKGESTTLTIDYDGALVSGDDSPVPGLKLAYVGDDTSYLLYAGRWFPVSGYGVNRFTATINVTAPYGTTVIGSGKETTNAVSAMAAVPKAAPPAKGAKGRAAAPPPAPAPATGSGPARTVHTFVWEKPSFPGTIIAGNFVETAATPGGVNLHLYFKSNHKDLASAYADTAGREFQYFSLLYGGAPSATLKVVEIPDDTVPSAWAPEIAAVASRSISEKTNYRLLANAIAHQWWGVSVSPVNREDFWLVDGFARYSEARYTENAAGPQAFEEGIKDISVGALAYDNIPLSGVGKLDPYSPEFQSLTTDKGAMILHMLRWIMGDGPFTNAMHNFATKFALKPATLDEFRQTCEQAMGGNVRLTGFFNQWLDSTGAPEFKNKYTVYRTKNGFRVVGQISQDLDLFRMPVELKIDTDGKSEMKRIDVSGTDSPYSVDTFGKPRRINIDPNNWVLKNSGELKVRTAILRGQQLVQQGDLAEALRQFQGALESNKNSSLAHYRIAEVFFLQRNYQSAANAYRESLNGDGEPRWTEVWSHIQLGKIYDITGQRDRATNEYRQALQTNDDTQGAQEEARKYLSAPYQRERKEGLGD